MENRHLREVAQHGEQGGRRPNAPTTREASMPATAISAIEVLSLVVANPERIALP